MPTAPYKTTPVFTEETLPSGLKSEHRTKQGVWGLLRVLEGEVRLVFAGSAQRIYVTPSTPAVIPPQATHHVETDGPMRMQVEFYLEQPTST